MPSEEITLSTYFDISDGSGFGKILLFLERTIKQNLQNNQRKTSGDASCSLFLKLLCCCEIEGGSVLILISVLDAAVDLLSHFVCKEVCPLCSAIRKTPFPQESQNFQLQFNSKYLLQCSLNLLANLFVTPAINQMIQ